MNFPSNGRAYEARWAAVLIMISGGFRKSFRGESVARKMKTCLRRFVAVVLCAALLQGVARAGAPSVVKSDPEHLLLLDRRVVDRVENAELRVTVPEKHPRNPLFVPDKPWENATNNFYPNVIWDEKASLWRLWYKDVLADADCIAKMDGPSTVHGVGWYLLYAESSDGLAWERPALGLHAFGGDFANNIVARECPNVGVALDPLNADPARRFRMVFDVGLGKPRVCFSGDGLHWGPEEEPKGFAGSQGDTHNNAFFDQRTGKWIWFTKMYLGERLISRLESDDFVNWRSSGVVLRSGIDEGRSTQTYALTVFPYANGYLGYLMLYHIGSGRRVDVELAWSSDSVHWERVAPGQPFLANGPAGSYDSGCIYAQAGPAVVKDGRISVYYGGSPTQHLGWKRSGSMCVASVPEDGFAYFAPKDPAQPAVVYTASLRPGADELRVHSEGGVRVAREELGQGNFRLKLTLDSDAKVYGIRGASLVDEAWKPKPEAPWQPLPVKRGPLALDFAEGDHGWKGVDAIEHLAGESCVRVSRGKGLRPIASGQPLPGNWMADFGGRGLTIRARLRAPEGRGGARIEVFAREVAQWYFETSSTVGSDWAWFEAPLDYGWTDAEAAAAGWVRTQSAFGWRDTLRNAGKVVVMQGTAGSSSFFDMAELMLVPR